MATINNRPLTDTEIRDQQNATVLEYVKSRGIQGAWMDGSTLKAPGHVPLRTITDDAGISRGGGGYGGETSYSQVKAEKFVHPEERARQMLAECILAVATTGQLPMADNRHEIMINEDGDLVTTTGHVAMKRNAEIEKLLPFFNVQFLEMYKEAMGHEFPEVSRFQKKNPPRP